MTPFANRSKLFTSGTTPHRFAAAAASNADLVVLDLEDSVPEPAKATSRDAVAAALCDGVFAERRCGVRINEVDGPFWRDDLEAVLTGDLDELHIPKVERPGQLIAVAAAVQDAEVEGPIGIVATIETARGVLGLRDIAESTPLLAGLQLGAADLALDTGMELDDTRLGWFRAQLAVTAAAVGIPAYDPVHLDHRDLAGFRASATEAKRWGMAGKSCIHPDQVPVANEVFAPDEQELERARRIVSAFDDATERGHGAVSVDGHLVDRPVARAAQRLLDAT